VLESGTFITQWPAVRTRSSGATSIPPHPPTSANHGTASGAMGSPPTTAPEGAAAARATSTVSRQARVMDMVFFG
jgi:hypothetical protein